jgi:drug/metabolite transporter (DMT)-like permease
MRAILAILVSMACFSVLNAMSKYLSQHYPVIEVLWARYFFALVVMLVLFLPRAGRQLFSIRRWDTQVTRGLLLFFSSLFYFNGIAHLPLATAASISLTSPIIVTALSPKLLGEQVGIRRWIAVGVGFVGAIIVVRPGHEQFNWYILLIVISTVCSAFYQLFSRRYGQTERADASATLATIVGTAVATPFVVTEFVAPSWGWHMALFGGMGIMAAVGHYFLTIAYSRAPAAIISPFNYMQLVGAAILGYAFFHEMPDKWTWIGSGVIIASGLYIGYRERVRHQLAKRAAKG